AWLHLLPSQLSAATTHECIVIGRTSWVVHFRNPFLLFLDFLDALGLGCTRFFEQQREPLVTHVWQVAPALGADDSVILVYRQRQRHVVYVYEMALCIQLCKRRRHVYADNKNADGFSC